MIATIASVPSCAGLATRFQELSGRVVQRIDLAEYAVGFSIHVIRMERLFYFVSNSVQENAPRYADIIAYGLPLGEAGQGEFQTMDQGQHTGIKVKKIGFELAFL